MQIGTQFPARDDDDYRVMAQLGVTHVSADPDGDPHDWTADALARHREKIESFGLTLAMVQLPLPSRPVEESGSADILLVGPRPRPPDRLDLRADRAAGRHRHSGRQMQSQSHRHSAQRRRAGARRLDELDLPLGPDGPGCRSGRGRRPRPGRELGAHRLFPRTSGARRRGVQSAPLLPPARPLCSAGLSRRHPRVLGTVGGLKKLVGMRESPYHGLNFCQGTMGEMLDDPATEVFDVIRWYGERDKIFHVHFRNIRGRKLSFMETFPEEGDMDMLRSIRLYAEFGCPHKVMPDHVPRVSGRDPENTALGFVCGYLAAQFEMLRAEGLLPG